MNEEKFYKLTTFILFLSTIIFCALFINTFLYLNQEREISSSLCALTQSEANLVNDCTSTLSLFTKTTYPELTLLNCTKKYHSLGD